MLPSSAINLVETGEKRCPHVGFEAEVRFAGGGLMSSTQNWTLTRKNHARASVDEKRGILMTGTAKTA